MPVGLLIYQSLGNFDGKAIQTLHLLKDRETADETFEKLKDAVTAYTNRANDREKLFTFSCVNGPASIDVSTIVCFGVDDAMDPEANKALKEWGACIRELRAVETPNKEPIE